MNVQWDKSWKEHVGDSSFYAILGVGQDARKSEIRTAYREKARQFHPDRNPDDAHAEAMFKIVNEANQVLREPYNRLRYNNMLDLSARDNQLFKIVVNELSNHNNLPFGTESYSTLKSIYVADGNFSRLYNSGTQRNQGSQNTPPQDDRQESSWSDTVNEHARGYYDTYSAWSDSVSEAVRGCYNSVSQGYSGLVSKIQNFPWKTGAKVAAGIAGIGIGYHVAMSNLEERQVPLEQIVEPTCDSVRIEYMGASTEVERINIAHKIDQLCK